jgi:CO/xanthine dehydrogenase FAD-binding subunit
MGALGEEPDYSIVPGEYMYENGRLKADTANFYLGANVFAGGDFVSGPSTVVKAITAGREAANRIDQYLDGKKIQCKENTSHSWISPDKNDTTYLGKTKRVIAPELPVSERVESLDAEEVSGLDTSAIKVEANRCFNCGCEGVNPSDLAAALVALDAKIVTSKRTIMADEFWAADKVCKSTVLESDEIVTEIQIPTPSAGTKSAFIKFALRKSIDFPIVNCAAALVIKRGIVDKARICLNAVYSSPYRATKAEDFIKGKAIVEANAEGAGTAALSDAIPLLYNKYKIEIAKALVERAILACK